MRIVRLEIKGYRGISDGILDLPQHGVLIGANNVGKSAVVEALALLSGRETTYGRISDWDFYRGQPDASTRFKIVATVSDFPTEDPDRIPGWFVGESAGQPMWWDPANRDVSFSVDPPEGGRLATQIAAIGRYDDELCEFQVIRYFYTGDSDPFVDGYESVSPRLLRELGIFTLRSNRSWDRLLSFGSATFMKVIREHAALPGEAVEALKRSLRDEVPAVDRDTPLSVLLTSAAEELKDFLLIRESSSLLFRPTSLDTLSVLQSLVAHVAEEEGLLLPIARHGDGVLSLQAFLLLLAFAEQRREENQNFILVAEEPELHLHPALHSRLVSRIRSASTQSLVTSQSPVVAAAFRPENTLFLQNEDGVLSATALRGEPVNAIPSNSIRKLYMVHRKEFYEALMGAVVLIPEGRYDFEWLSLLLRLAQTAAEEPPKPISVVPTEDAAIVATLEEVSRFRPDAVPLIDGDVEGGKYLEELAELESPPDLILRYGRDAAVECLVGWVLDPQSADPPEAMNELLAGEEASLKNLQNRLISEKKNRDLRERVVWESCESSESVQRACSFFNDVFAIAVGSPDTELTWTTEVVGDGVKALVVEDIVRA